MNKQLKHSVVKKKTIKKDIQYNQRMAIQLGQELAAIIVTDKNIADVFLDKMKNIPIGTKRSDIMKEMPQIHPDISIFSNATLRCAARHALKELLSDKEYENLKVISMQKHGKSRIGDLQANNGTKILTQPERDILDRIAKNPANYKNSSVRNINKIMEEIRGVIDFPRSKDTIEKYMRQFSPSLKQFISWDKDPNETKYLKELFDRYYVPGQKLPTQKITNELNAKFSHNRSQGAVECYVRSHFKTPEEKQFFTSNLWCGKEKDFIKNIIKHSEQYKYSGGQFHGGYNLGRIMQEFKEKFPNSERTKPAIKHQIDKQEKLLVKQRSDELS